MPTNVQKLITYRAAQIATERAKEKYGVANAATLAAGLLDGNLLVSLREATSFVKAALETIRKSPGSEQWPTDEAVAGEILRRIAADRGA